ncbi:uncharacterized protein BXZ73DRAFT_99195 [Epithele typhae]|uniref:uncharacterized protein n=1 Tax=Epithele typhae TaxID=378194 RepID=UPI0020076C73|nr:uncharacterized protein BXZ73DRAFT_99195 [Epithele typhae]KAH9940199.1 hypothetical protein BXZ73DRAFT_99195 [Epithele typhae]
MSAIDPTRPPPRVPPEISDNILRCLNPSPYKDRKTLLHCMLVSHNWLPASRYVLCSDPYIPSLEQAHLFLTRVVQVAPLSTAPLRRLSIDVLDTKGHSPSLGAVLASLAIHAPNLEDLKLHHITSETSTIPPRSLLSISNLTKLVRLELCQCTFRSFSILRRTLAALPHLRDLATRRVKFPISPNDTMVKSYTSPRPDLLSVSLLNTSSKRERDHLDVLLHFLANTSSCASLNELTVKRGWAYGPTSSLFRASLARLLLAVDVFEFDDESDPREALSFLSSLRNVRKLSLRFFHATAGTVLEIVHGLVQGNSPNLVDFTLTVPLDALTLATETDLIELANLTSRRPFSTVKNARIRLHTYKYYDLDISGAQALEVMARMWPLISQDAQVDLTLFYSIFSGDVWEWNPEVKRGTSFWEGGKTWDRGTKTWKQCK